MNIVKGIVKEPHFVCIYGEPGLGKTTFAAEAPKSIIVGPERGANKINVDKVYTPDWASATAAIKELRNDKHDYQSMGFDSLDTFEPAVWDETVRRDGKAKNIEAVGGGYQKGYAEALDLWREFIESLKDLRSNRNMNVIAIAHSRLITIKDPMQMSEYDRHTLRLYENKSVSTSGLWIAHLDALMFVTNKDTVFKVNEKDKKAKATGGDERVLYTTRTAAFNAKNRLGLPDELKFERGYAWSEFARAADLGQPDSMENVMRDLTLVLASLEGKDQKMIDRIKAAVEKAGSDLGALINIRNHALKVEAA